MHQPYEYDQPRQPGPASTRVMFHQFRHGQGRGLVIGSAAVAVLALAVAAASLAMMFLTRGADSTQLASLHQQVGTLAGRVGTLSGQLATARQANAGLASRVDSLAPVVTGMAPYGLVCAQALESQNGPGTYYFPCSGTKP